MEITIKQKTSCWEVFIIKTIITYIAITTKEIPFFQFQFITTIFSNSFGINLNEFVLQSNSKGKFLSPQGLHINLIGQIKHLNIYAIQIRINHLKVFIHHFITHILIKGVESRLNPEAPVKPLIQIIMKIIPYVIP